MSIDSQWQYGRPYRRSRLRQFVTSPFRFAKWLVVPEGDRALPGGYQILYYVRSVVALAVILGIRAYLGIPQADEAPTAVVFAPYVQISIMLTLTILATAVLPFTNWGRGTHLGTSPGRQRPRHRPAWAVPIQSVLLSLVSAVITIAAAATIGWVTIDVTDRKETELAQFIDAHLWSSALLVATWPFFLWCIAFLFTIQWMVVIHGFRWADGHPFLAPILSACTAWGMSIYGMVYGDAATMGAGPGQVPPKFALFLNITGPVVVTALAAGEIWYRRRIARQSGRY
ncbi:hypothetical protein ACFVWG_05935 [Kribbella sp. NPDC058245]|uniref:hypothetical protein n=1 Tax=Kribbella sp. NPDC058245 TaxID=3346399 RepID=UPI0036E17337